LLHGCRIITQITIFHHPSSNINHPSSFLLMIVMMMMMMMMMMMGVRECPPFVGNESSVFLESLLHDLRR